MRRGNEGIRKRYDTVLKNTLKKNKTINHLAHQRPERKIRNGKNNNKNMPEMLAFTKTR